MDDLTPVPSIETNRMGSELCAIVTARCLDLLSKFYSILSVLDDHGQIAPESTRLM